MLLRLDTTGESPALDLDDGGAAALHAALSTPAGPDPHTAQLLADGGVLVDGRPHPLVTPMLSTLARPRGRIGVRLCDVDDLVTHDVRHRDGCVVLSASAGTVRRLFIVPTGGLARHLARLVGLGPRPVLPDPEAVIVSSAFPTLGDAHAQVRRDAAAALVADLRQPWPEAAEALAVGRWRLWAVTWEDPPGSVTTRLVVVDTPAGLLRVSTCPGPAGLLDPMTSRRAWIDLVAATPGSARQAVP